MHDSLLGVVNDSIKLKLIKNYIFLTTNFLRIDVTSDKGSVGFRLAGLTSDAVVTGKTPVHPSNTQSSTKPASKLQ